MTEETKSKQEFSGYLTGQFLLAMPHLQDPRYEKTVIYICGHDTNGAMGLVVNKHLGDLTLKGLLEYLNLPQESIRRDLPIYFYAKPPLIIMCGFMKYSRDLKLNQRYLAERHKKL